MRRQRSNQELFFACLQGEDAAWGLLVARYQAFIMRIAQSSFGLCDADAEDIFQNVCLKLWLYMGQIREPDYLTAWLATTTRQECMRFVRRPATETLEGIEILPEEEVRFDELLIEEERREILRSGLSRLNPECRELLELLYGSPPVSYAQAAEQLGVAVGGIGPRRARCLERLRNLWESSQK